MDMIAMTLKAMGVDPAEIMRQAAGLGAAFETMARGQVELRDKLDLIERQQTAIMSAMGLYVPVPDGETKALIEAGSKAWIDAHGGQAMDEPLARQTGLSEDLAQQARSVSLQVMAQHVIGA